MVGTKLILTFVDEKKGTIKFVTLLFYPSHYSSTIYISFFAQFLPINIMYARTSIYITIHLFFQHFTILHKSSGGTKKKALDN